MLQSFVEIKELVDCKAADQKFAQLFTEIMFSLKENAMMIKTSFHLLKLLIDGQGSIS